MFDKMWSSELLRGAEESSYHPDNSGLDIPPNLGIYASVLSPNWGILILLIAELQVAWP